ncbi:hypothetical protein NLJ89_g317 [Agrocybe chaxingu]|uniref:SAM domain-containing protein n=1 Tax=Agrocybe chaxingu TaxID=84603 RepID=A0A9W8TGM0_9AGAR|nr:hypothetical protein NLJ89_g317 [Agrocybe chaxingu]
MDGQDTYTSKDLLEWDETDVHQWLSSLGYPYYEHHKIQGDTLCVLDSEALKSLGVTSIGQRLSILKAVYHLKLVNEISIDEDDYVPPSEAHGPSESVTTPIDNIAFAIEAQRLRSLEEENRTLTNVMASFLDEMVKLRTSLGLSTESSNGIRKQLPYSRSDIQAATSSETVSSSAGSYTMVEPSSSAYATPLSQDTPDAANNARVSLADPTWKVLPAALKKHNIKNDDWQSYAMFISYGPPGNRTKRRLELDEKPLYLFKKLKDAKQNPAFLLKNMKDLRSPFPDDSRTLIVPNSTSPSPYASSPGPSQARRHLYPTPYQSSFTPGSQIEQ